MKIYPATTDGSIYVPNGIRGQFATSAADTWPTSNYGCWFDGTNYYFKEYGDLFTTSNLTNPPTQQIENLYSGSGLSVPSGYMGGTWHNWPNTNTSAIITGYDGTKITDCGLSFNTVRSHDYYPNSTGPVRWQWLEQSKGNFTWTNLDEFVNTNYASGKDIIYTLGFTPNWASTAPPPAGGSVYGGVACNVPDSMTDWTDYCSAVATRYIGKIKYYEVWNEPDNGVDWFNGTEAQYAEMLRLAYQTIKAIDSNAVIMGPASSMIDSTGQTWLDNMLNASDGAGGSGKDWLELITMHNYYRPNNFANFSSDFDGYKAVLSSNGLGSLEVWCDEIGISELNGIDHEDNIVEQFFLRQIYMAAAKGIGRILWYDIDGPRFGYLGRAASVTRMVNLWNTHRGYLVNGQVTLINKLWDSRLAITANGTNMLI